MKKLAIKTISLVLLSAFCVNTCCYGLATLPASQNSIAKREILDFLQRSRVIIAENEGVNAEALLRSNIGRAVLLNSGEILVSKKTYENNSKLLQAIRYANYNALLKIYSNDALRRQYYETVKAEILSRIPFTEANMQRFHILEYSNSSSPTVNDFVNHLVAYTIEYISASKGDVDSPEQLLHETSEVGQLLQDIIMANTDTLFTVEFFDPAARETKIREAIFAGAIFYKPKTDALQKLIIGNSIVSRKKRLDEFFLIDGQPNGHLRNLTRHFSVIESLIKGEPVTPVSIEIQPSGTCNISCRYCGFQEKRKQHKGVYITEEQMRDLIIQIEEFNKTSPQPVTEIKFNGIFSEPLAGPAKRATVLGLKMAAERGFWTGIFTNGLELDEEVCKALVIDKERSAAFTNISIDAGKWETYHKLKRPQISPEVAKKEYLKIINNIRGLVKRRNKYGSKIYISISCVLQKETSVPEEIGAIIKMAKELGVDNVRFRYPYKRAEGAPFNNDIMVAYETIKRYVEEFKDDKKFSIAQIYGEAETFEQMQKLLLGKAPPKKFAKCRVPYIRMTVSPDGNFYPCDHRGYIGGGTLGTIGNGFRPAIESESRGMHIDGIEPNKDTRCDICAMYNQYLNETIEFMEAEYAKDKDVFTWIRNEYDIDVKDKPESINKWADGPITNEQVDSGIGQYINLMPPKLANLLDVSQNPQKHFEGPTLKHHLQAMLSTFEQASSDVNIPNVIKATLVKPEYRDFFTDFILYHDIGKHNEKPAIAHAERSFEIASNQSFDSISPHLKEILLKAIRAHMDVASFTHTSASLFQKQLQKIGLNLDKESALLYASAIYLDGRATWSDGEGHYNLPNVDFICSSCEQWIGETDLRGNELAILDKEIEKNVNVGVLAEFKSYLVAKELGEFSKKVVPSQIDQKKTGTTFINMKSEFVPGQAPIDLTSLRDSIADVLSGASANNLSKPKTNTYKGFDVEKPYDPNECIKTLFSDQEFIENISLLATDSSGFKRVQFKDQEHILEYIKEVLKADLKKYEISPISESENDELADRFSKKIAKIINIVTEITYPYFSNKTKDIILKNLPSFIQYQIDIEFKEFESSPISSDFQRKIFTDLFIRSIYFQVNRMAEYNQFLPRQLYLTLQIFNERFNQYVKRSGLGDCTPVLLLRDGEPLSYPFLGLFGKPDTEKPELVYFNRLSTMTFEERMRFSEESLAEKSDFTQSIYASNTKLYTFINGSQEKNTPSALLESIKEAQIIAHKSLETYLISSDYAKADSIKREQILDQAYAAYNSDVEKLMIVLLSKKIAGVMLKDDGVRATLNDIYSFVVPESLKGEANRKRKAVFIDSGIKGSLPVLLSCLVLLNDLGGCENDRMNKLESISSDIIKLRELEVRARAFIYGTTTEYRSVVPNAGFERFGFGGVNSFIELLPRFASYGFLNARGFPEAATSGEINFSRAYDLMKGLGQYVSRKEGIVKAASLNDVEAIIRNKIAKTNKPLYLFIDLDNVIIQPAGFVASEAWYQTEADAIRSRDALQKQRLFSFYKRYDRHLVENNNYDILLDIRKLRLDLVKAYPDRQIKVICLSARNEAQREVTERTIKNLGLWDQVDLLSLSQRLGQSKKERLIDYMESKHIDINNASADIVVIDDAMHHIAPFMPLINKGIIPILFTDSRENYREKSALFFFERGRSEVRLGNINRAKEYFINALKNRYMPLSYDDIKLLSSLEGDLSKVLDDLLIAVKLSDEWVSPDDASIIEATLIKFCGSHPKNISLTKIFSQLIALNKSTGLFRNALFHLYETIYKSTPDETLKKLWSKLEVVSNDFDKDADFYLSQSITKGAAIENAILDFAYSFGNHLDPENYAVQFIKILSPYFSKERVMELFPEGVLFKGDFQWLQNSSDSDYDFYYNGVFYIYHNDIAVDSSFLISGKTYQEAKIGYLNKLILNEPVGKTTIRSVTVFPTLYCNVGCKVCMYASPPEPESELKNPEMFLSDASILESIALISSYPNLESLYIGGGGEPFLELENIATLISKTNVPNIKIYTSGDWGKEPGKVSRTFLTIHRAIASRSKPANIEINVSADDFHTENIGTFDRVGHLKNILSTFINAKRRGRFASVSLHFRGLSKTGKAPVSEEPDDMMRLIAEYEKEHSELKIKKIGFRENGFDIAIDGEVFVRVSYNELMLRNGSNSRRLISEMKDSSEGFLFDRVFIDSDRTVSLGGYYKAIPVGKLKEMPAAVLSGLSEKNIVASVMREKGFSYFLRLAEEYDPNLARSPPLSVTNVDLMSAIMSDPHKQIYIYYRIVQDLLNEGKIDNGIADSLGIKKTTAKEALIKLATISSEQLLVKSKTKKVNWGFSAQGVPIRDTRFSNIWHTSLISSQASHADIDRQKISNPEKITTLVGKMLKSKYGIDDPDIRSVTVVGSFIPSKSKKVPPKDLDVVVTIGHAGIRDFIPEIPYDLNGTFPPNIENIPKNISIWVLSENCFNASTSNIIDVDLALTVLNGTPIIGSLPQIRPAPIIEKIKQAHLFAVLLQKMHSDMDVLKLFKRKLEISAILEQLRVIALSSKEELLSSDGLSDLDKRYIEKILPILRVFFSNKEKFDLSKGWEELDELADLVSKLSDPSEASRRDILLSSKRRIIEDYAIAVKTEMFSLIEQLYSLEKNYLSICPPQESRQWLVNIYKSNTPTRSYDEHMSIAALRTIDYSTAASLAFTTPYPAVLKKLYTSIIQKESSLTEVERTQIIRLIAGNVAVSKKILKDIKNSYRDDTIIGSLQKTVESKKAAEKLLFNEWGVFPFSHNEDVVDALMVAEFAGHRRFPQTEKELGKIGLLAPEPPLRAVIDRIIYAPTFDGTPIFMTLDKKDFESLVDSIVIAYRSGKRFNVFSKTKSAALEVLTKKMAAEKGGKISIGFVTFPDKEGPSVSNRINISTVESALDQSGLKNYSYEVFDLQFVTQESFLNRHFDLLILDARQENCDNFFKAIDEIPFAKLANHILIQGSYLSVPGAFESIRTRTQDRLKAAIIAYAEPEPAVVGLVKCIADEHEPLILVPNISIPTNLGEYRTFRRRADLSGLMPRLYPYLQQIKNSSWFNYFVEASRGCQHGTCTFCTDKLLYGPGWRPYSVESILSIFKELNESGIQTAFIFDKDFWGKDYQRAEKIARGLIAMDNKVRYTVALRPDEIIEGEHLLELFKKSGLSLIFMGPESYEHNTLKRFSKGVDTQINLEAVKVLKDHSVDFGLGFIIDPLASINEVGESLRAAKSPDILMHTASFFNSLRVKKGTGYDLMMDSQGLLGDISSDGQSFESGFKDARVATLVQSIADCLEEVPPLNFIYIISKRRLPLKSESDFRELEKYNKHFATLQKTNLDMLLSLVEALETNHPERVRPIVQRYIKTYKNAVELIERELDPSNPVSKNILDYISRKMKTRVDREKPAPFPDRVIEAYKNAENQTLTVTRNGVSPVIYTPNLSFNLNLVAGASFISGAKSDLPNSLTERLSGISEELNTISGNTIMTMPQNRLRLSLFSFYLGEPIGKSVSTISNPTFLNNIASAVKNISGYLPIKVRFRGIFINSAGAIMLKGYVDNDSIEVIRKILHKTIPNSARNLHLDTPFIAITIGRVAKNMSPEKFKELVGKIESYKDVDFGEVLIRNLVIEASSDFSGFTPLDDVQNAFSQINNELLNSSPRVMLVSFSDQPSLFGVANSDSMRFPLALNTLKGFIKSKFGDSVTVSLFDSQQESDIANIIKQLKERRVEMVGLSVTMGQGEQVRKILDGIQTNIDISARPLVVLGNNFFDSNSHDFLNKYPWVIICKNEGEYAIAGLVEHLRQKKSLREIPNIMYVKDGQIVENPIMPVSPNDVARPTFDTLDEVLASGESIFQWEASRGCPWGLCRFCSRPATCKGWRAFPINKVLDELFILQGRGIKSVYFSDEDFIGLDFSRASKIAQGIIDRGIKMELSFSTSVRDVFSEKDTPQQAKEKRDCFSLLKKAGCKRIMLGLESGSDKQLMRYAKGVTAHENAEAVKLLRDELGYQLISGFIMFDPLMKAEEIIKNTNFIVDLNLEECLYALGKMRIGDSCKYYLNKLREKGLLLGKKVGADDYAYNFESEDVNRIVSIVDAWKTNRNSYNEAFRQSLFQYPSRHDYISSVYRTFQLAVRRFDISFLYAITFCFTQSSETEKFKNYLNTTGYSNDEIERLTAIISHARSAKLYEEKMHLIGNVLKSLASKREEYLMGVVKACNASQADVNDDVKFVTEKRISSAVNKETRFMVASFTSMGFINKNTSVRLIAIMNRKEHYLCRNDLSVEALAGDLRGHFSNNVDVAVDMARDRDEISALMSEIKKGDMPDIIGISVHLGSLGLVETFMNFLTNLDAYKKKKPLIVFGNQIPTYFPEKMLEKYPDIMVVMGEGEEAMRELVEYVKGRGSLKDIGNLAYKDKRTGQIVYTKDVYPDASKLIHSPSMDTVDQVLSEGGNVMLQTSRGCAWGRCSFCTKSQFRHAGKTPPPEKAYCWSGLDTKRVLDTFEEFYARGVKSIEIVAEDHFIGGRDEENIKRVEAIVDGLRILKEKYGRVMEFIIFVRPNIIYQQGDPEGNNRMKDLLKKMKEVGFSRVFLEADSGSITQSRRFMKGLSLSQVEGSIRMMEELGLQVHIGYIMFDPELTLDEMLENIKFFRNTNLVRHNQYPCRALELFYKTTLAEDLKAKGLLGELDMNLLHYKYFFAHKDVERIYKIILRQSARTTPTYATCREAKKYFKDHNMIREMGVVQGFMEEIGNMYLDLMEQLALNIKRGNDNAVSETTGNAIAKINDIKQRLSATIDLTTFKMNRPKDLSRGDIDELHETHVALDGAANDGRLFAITLEQVTLIDAASAEMLANMIMPNLLNLKNREETRGALARRLENPVLRNDVIRGFELMQESLERAELPSGKPVRLCLVLEGDSLPTIIFRDTYNNLIAHSGSGKKTNAPFISIYAGMNSLKVAMDLGREDYFKSLVAHETTDIIRGEHTLSGTDSEARKLYDNVLDLYDVGSSNVLHLDLMHKFIKEGRFYEIMYDTSRLSPPQIGIVEQYIKLLKSRVSSADHIRSKPFASSKTSKEPLMSVRCTSGNFHGEGHVDIAMEDGSLKDYALRISGMINIALASSNIPDNLSKEEVQKYRPIFAFIRNQYRSIVGVDLSLPSNIIEIVKTIKWVVLNLPKTLRFDSDKIEEFNSLAKTALINA